jgi:hypothetical protein
MSRAKTLLVALFALSLIAAAFATTSAMALELPDVHILEGETYPVTGEGTVKGEDLFVLETELGEKILAREIKIKIELSELTSLGIAVVDLTETVEKKLGGTKCNTVGDAAGVVLINGEYHIVDISTSPLTIAFLLLFPELTLECGKVKVKVRSPLIASITKVTSGTETTQFGIASKCSGKGKQELREYLNDEGAKTKGTLSANFGLGFETACVSTGIEVVINTTKMIDFLF